MKGKLKRTIIKVYKGIKKLIKIIRELGIEKVVKISIFSLIIITVVILLIKICFKTEVANINDIKINIDKELLKRFYLQKGYLWAYMFI